MSFKGRREQRRKTRCEKRGFSCKIQECTTFIPERNKGKAARQNYIPLSLTYTLTFINKNNVFDFQSIKNFYIYIHNDMRLYELKSIYNFASEKDTQDINRPKPSNLLNSDGDSSPTVPCNGTITLHTKKGSLHTHESALHTQEVAIH